MSVVAAAPCAFVAMLMVMALYEEEKTPHRAQHAGAFDLNAGPPPALWAARFSACCRRRWIRVLGVVRLPRGAFLLRKAP